VHTHHSTRNTPHMQESVLGREREREEREREREREKRARVCPGHRKRRAGFFLVREVGNEKLKEREREKESETQSERERSERKQKRSYDLNNMFRLSQPLQASEHEVCT